MPWVLRRSCSVHAPPSTRSSAWFLETDECSRTTVFAGSRPMVTTWSSPHLRSWPFHRTMISPTATLLLTLGFAVGGHVHPPDCPTGALAGAMSLPAFSVAACTSTATSLVSASLINQRYFPEYTIDTQVSRSTSTLTR